MNMNEVKAKKILKQFNSKFPRLIVTHIYDSTKYGTIIRAEEDPEVHTMGVPYYKLLPGNIVVNANPFANPKKFKQMIDEKYMIYHNTDIVYPDEEGSKDESNTI